MMVVEVLSSAILRVRHDWMAAVASTVGLALGFGFFALWSVMAAGLDQDGESRLTAGSAQLLAVAPGETAGSDSQEAGLPAVAAQLRRLGFRLTTTAEADDFIEVGGKRIPALVRGATGEYPDLIRLPLERGRFMGQNQILAGRRVTVIDSGAAVHLFGSRDPVGKRVTIAGTAFTVVGVAQQAGAPTLGAPPALAFVPLTVAEDLFAAAAHSQLLVEAESRTQVSRSASRSRLEQILEEEFGRGRYVVRDQAQLVPEEAEESLRLRLIALTGSASSLLLGAIALGGFLTTSVARRRREIAARRLAGAGSAHVASQLVAEAVILSFLAAVTGLGLSAAASPYLAHRVPVQLEPMAIAWTLGGSLVLAILAGAYPALLAARLRLADLL